MTPGTTKRAAKRLLTACSRPVTLCGRAARMFPIGNTRTLCRDQMSLMYPVGNIPREHHPDVPDREHTIYGHLISR